MVHEAKVRHRDHTVIKESKKGGIGKEKWGSGGRLRTGSITKEAYLYSNHST